MKKRLSLILLLFYSANQINCMQDRSLGEVARGCGSQRIPEMPLVNAVAKLAVVWGAYDLVAGRIAGGRNHLDLSDRILGLGASCLLVLSNDVAVRFGEIGASNEATAVRTLGVAACLLAAHGHAMTLLIRSCIANQDKLIAVQEMAIAFMKERENLVYADSISIHEVDNTESLNKSLRKIENDDRCVICGSLFEELKNKTVMQTQCCGQIFCKEDLLSFAISWKKRSHQVDEVITCFACRTHPLLAKEIGCDSASVIKIGREDRLLD